ncbi:hypothetical protein LV84_03510 [Algoriphagus ratkowskyi]|uniref:Integral membrane protein n=1 Tax=Algoriphagus ratkowskyi TaxID=57028 RepID=A0A2W7SMZ1_9BACT|nr:hypothetical protein [Algoriphagus ratkowskyi]PZX52102.1 hypothetical protein LV84_03510 [Algoriphagus ratkowskyi]TXD76133.1 hypothetical protein ESW18_17860 [Algoriphagus ratkowskyi]
MKIPIGVIFIIFSFSCANAQVEPATTTFGEGVAVGILTDKVLDEISGMSTSRTVPGLIYVHNDSGGEAAVYLLDSLGKSVGKIEFLGVKNRDWEDIAVGPGADGKSYIYVGEIGDNNAVHDEIALYRIPEPVTFSSNSRVTPQKITLKYPGGPRDAESLMVDPISGDIFIISKRDSLNTLYRLPANKFGAGDLQLEELIKLPITSAVGADISADGSQILVKNYFSIYYWKRTIGESIEQAMTRTPIELPYSPEPQGEAIGFLPSGKAYYTLSEKRFDIEPVLYKYTAK